MKFGEFLKNQRETKEWTQPEAAEAIGIEQSYLSKLENNKALPSTEMFDKLMETYGFDIDQIGQSVGDSELDKLKEIVIVRDFIIRHKQRNETTRHRWLVTSLVCLMLGVAILSYGILLKDNVNTTYVYESKGVILDNEPSYIFAELPGYHSFLSMMKSESKRKELKALKLFTRIEYKQLYLSEYQGNFFDKHGTSATGHRRYFLIDKRDFPSKEAFYKGVSFGMMLLMGGLGALFMSRRW